MAAPLRSAEHCIFTSSVRFETRTTKQNTWDPVFIRSETVSLSCGPRGFRQLSRALLRSSSCSQYELPFISVRQAMLFTGPSQAFEGLVCFPRMCRNCSSSAHINLRVARCSVNRNTNNRRQSKIHGVSSSAGSTAHGTTVLPA